MMRIVSFLPKGIALSILLLASVSIQAATVQVTVGDNFFSPPVSRINVNDAVRWTWVGTLQQHSTTHVPPTGQPLWDAPAAPALTSAPGFTFTKTFTSAGSFPYKCRNFLHTTQTGTVVVAAANIAPSVNITSPPNAAVFAAPATINILASATDSDGTVSQVEFFRNGTSIGVDTSSPFSSTDTNVVVGTNVYSAVARDNSGATSSSQITVTVVRPVDVQLSNISRPSASEFRFDYSANVGLKYVVERSLDLLQWQPLGTNTASTATVTFTDSSANAGQGFYRVGRVPNP